MIKTFLIVLSAVFLSHAQLTLSGEGHYSFSRSNLISNSQMNDGTYIHDKALVSNILSEEWLGWSLCAGYLLKNTVSFHLTCSPAYSIASPRNNAVSFSRWGSYNEKVTPSVDYNIPVYISIKYHLKTKGIKPYFGILSGLSMEKMSYETTILTNDLPPQISNNDEFNRYFLIGADAGADWYFRRHAGITAGFNPEFLIKNEFLNFTGVFHGGIIFSF